MHWVECRKNYCKCTVSHTNMPYLKKKSYGRVQQKFLGQCLCGAHICAAYEWSLAFPGKVLPVNIRTENWCYVLSAMCHKHLFEFCCSNLTGGRGIYYMSNKQAEVRAEGKRNENIAHMSTRADLHHLKMSKFWANLSRTVSSRPGDIKPTFSVCLIHWIKRSVGTLSSWKSRSREAPKMTRWHLWCLSLWTMQLEQKSCSILVVARGAW